MNPSLWFCLGTSSTYRVILTVPFYIVRVFLCKIMLEKNIKTNANCKLYMLFLNKHIIKRYKNILFSHMNAKCLLQPVSNHFALGWKPYLMQSAPGITLYIRLSGSLLPQLVYVTCAPSIQRKIPSWYTSVPPIHHPNNPVISVNYNTLFLKKWLR